MAYTNTAIPSSQRIATTNNYISSSAFLGNIEGITDADRGEMLVERYGSQNLSGLLEMLGNKAPVDSSTFYHYEESWIHSTITGTYTAATTTLALKANVSTVDMGGSNLDISPVREGDILMDAGGGVLRVLTVTATTSAVSALCEVVSGTPDTNTDAEFAIVGNAFQEGTDQPRGLTPGVIEYKNYTQIIKEAYEVSGSALTEKIWFEVDDPATGRSGYLWALKGEGDTFRRFNNYVETQMIVGRPQAPAPGQAGMTEGLEQFVRAGGNVEPVPAVGDLADGGAVGFLKTLTDALDENRGAKENMFLMGYTLAANLDLELTRDTRLINGAVSYGALNGSKELATGFGIDSIALNGYTFHKMRYEPFSYPQMLGAIGYSNQGCVIPMDSQRDASTRASIPSLRIRYKAAEGYSREMEHWMEGGAGLDVKTNGLDVLKLNYRTERGFEGFAANRFIWVEPASA